jgi:excisionase family DNA binding protein
MQLETQPTIDLLTVEEVARRLRVNTTTVRRWIKLGTLEAVTLPHAGKRASYRIYKATLTTMIEGGTSHAQAPTRHH